MFLSNMHLHEYISSLIMVVSTACFLYVSILEVGSVINSTDQLLTVDIKTMGANFNPFEPRCLERSTAQSVSFFRFRMIVAQEKVMEGGVPRFVWTFFRWRGLAFSTKALFCSCLSLVVKFAIRCQKYFTPKSGPLKKPWFSSMKPWWTNRVFR